MTALRPLLATLLAAAPLAAAPLAAAAQQPAGLPRARAPDTGSTCYHSSNSSTSYTPIDENTILVRDGPSAFKIAVNQCSNLKGINPVIVNVLHTGDLVCSALDLQMTVLDTPGGFPQPCIATGLTRIDDAEAKALSARARR